MSSLSGAPLEFVRPWRPISPDELKITSLAEAPGDPAVFLYRQDGSQTNSFSGVRGQNARE
jgi:hypothetical protein